MKYVLQRIRVRLKKFVKKPIIFLNHNGVCVKVFKNERIVVSIDPIRKSALVKAGMGDHVVSFIECIQEFVTFRICDYGVMNQPIDRRRVTNAVHSIRDKIDSEMHEWVEVGSAEVKHMMHLLFAPKDEWHSIRECVTHFDEFAKAGGFVRPPKPERTQYRDKYGNYLMYAGKRWYKYDAQFGWHQDKLLNSNPKAIVALKVRTLEGKAYKGTI